MNLLFTICARAGSKGLKNKNIKNFLNYPLPYYTLSAIDLFQKKNYNKYDNITICINTDSAELVDIMKKTVKVFSYIPRKEHLATDTAAKIDVIRDTLKECEAENRVSYDVVVDLDLTSPLRTLADIENAINTLCMEQRYDIVFSVTGSRRNPFFNMVKEEQGKYSRVISSNLTTRQKAPNVYDMNASIYAYKPDFLKKEENPGIFDGEVGVIKMLDTAVLDIDSEEDFELMQILAEYFYQNHEDLAMIRENITTLRV